jgi:tetratricopeptide (TPR) repeat protein
MSCVDRQRTPVALPLAWLAIFTLGTATVSAQGRDQVDPLRGATASGTILRVSPTEVTIEVRGSQTTFAVNEIRRISFADEPNELRRARESILLGELETGLDTLQRIDPSNVERDLVSQDIQYYTAYCQGKLALSGGGDKAAAVAALLDFVRGSRESFHFFEAAELLGDLAVALGSYENAAKYYSVLSAAPWPEYQLRGDLLQARALAGQGQFTEALAKYTSVVDSTIDTPDAIRLRLLARVGQAACFAETDRPDEGVTLLEGLIAENDPQDAELFGRAYNALGRCFLKMGKTKDALLAFLHVDLLFFAASDAHAEALYFLAQAWEAVNKSDRAIEARNTLRQRYAGSTWARRP